MFQRIVNPRRVLMVLAFGRKTLNHQDHTIFRNTCPQIRQARILPQVFPPRNYCSVAEAEVQETNQVLNILKEKEWCNETVGKLNGISDISEDHVASALKTLNPGKALSFYEWYKKHPSYKPSSSVYNAKLSVLSKKKTSQNFWKFAEEMKEHGFLMERNTLLSVMMKFQKKGMSKDVLKLFIWTMETKTYKPDVYCCFIVLHFLSKPKKPDVDAAKRVVEAFTKAGGTMDKRAFDALHRCLTKAERFEEAMDTMKSYTPDNITYSQLIFGLCKAKKCEEARKIIHDMKEKGCDPDMITWSVLMEGHLNANETDKSLELFWEMVESGCNVDFRIFKALIDYLFNNKREMDACNVMLKVIEEKKLNANPSHFVYVEVIKKLANSGMFEEASKFFDLTAGQFSYGHVALARPIISLLGKRGTVDDAYNFVLKVKKKGVLSGKACNEIAKCFCEAGRQSEALELISRLPPLIGNSPEMKRIINVKESDKSKSKGSKDTDTGIKKDADTSVSSSPENSKAAKAKKTDRKKSENSAEKDDDDEMGAVTEEAA